MRHGDASSERRVDVHRTVRQRLGRRMCTALCGSGSAGGRVAIAQCGAHRRAARRHAGVEPLHQARSGQRPAVITTCGSAPRNGGRRALERSWAPAERRSLARTGIDPRDPRLPPAFPVERDPDRPSESRSRGDHPVAVETPVCTGVNRSSAGPSGLRGGGLSESAGTRQEPGSHPSALGPALQSFDRAHTPRWAGAQLSAWMTVWRTRRRRSGARPTSRSASQPWRGPLSAAPAVWVPWAQPATLRLRLQVARAVLPSRPTHWHQGMLSRFSSLLVSSADKPEYTAVLPSRPSGRSHCGRRRSNENAGARGRCRHSGRQQDREPAVIAPSLRQMGLGSPDSDRPTRIARLGSPDSDPLTRTSRVAHDSSPALRRRSAQGSKCGFGRQAPGFLATVPLRRASRRRSAARRFASR